MKKIEFICIGNLKFKQLKQLEEKYLQNINYYVKFTIKNLKEFKLKDEEALKKKEFEMILKHIDKRDFVIALDEKGKKLSSVMFARFLAEKMDYFPGKIVFIMGGYAGFSKELDKYIDYQLSFSDMTIAHDLFRIVFLEQLYRALTIIKGVKYHR